jgi:hypothetical protein
VKLIKFEKASMLSIYPNPVNGFAKISVPNTSIGHPFTVTDQMGTIVLKGLIQNTSTPIDFKNLVAGCYFVQIGKLRKMIIKL